MCHTSKSDCSKSIRGMREEHYKGFLMTDLVHSYSMENGGKFEVIECPILIPTKAQTEEEWLTLIGKAGYGKNYSFAYDSCEVFSQDNLEADCDHPYFVLMDICYEGRIIFMKKWYDLTHFLNNHCKFLELAIEENTNDKLFDINKTLASDD